VSIHDNACAIPAFVSFPHRVIEVLGRLQAQTTPTVPSSLYIYSLVEQQTLCSSYSIAAMLGYTTRQIQSLDALGLAALIHPDDLQQVSEHFQRFTTLVEGEVVAVEYRMRRANGAWCWLRSQESVLVEAIGGFPLQVLGLVQDITQLVNGSSSKLVRLGRLFRQRTSASRRMRLVVSKRSRSHLFKPDQVWINY
jgi:PAS domain S-box-containing protein